MEKGRWYLFSSQFFTHVGRYEGCDAFRMYFADAGYFTRTGATFDVLCAKGLQGNSEFHGPMPGLTGAPLNSYVWEWHAPTPWATKKKAGAG